MIDRPFLDRLVVVAVLTTLQTSQMAVGIYVTVMAMNYGEDDSGAPCNVLRTNSFLGLFMYASYFALFLHFAVMSYCTKKPAGKKKQESTRNPAADGTPAKGAAPSKTKAQTPEGKSTAVDEGSARPRRSVKTPSKFDPAASTKTTYY